MEEKRSVLKERDVYGWKGKCMEGKGSVWKERELNCMEGKGSVLNEIECMEKR